MHAWVDYAQAGIIFEYRSIYAASSSHLGRTGCNKRERELYNAGSFSRCGFYAKIYERARAPESQIARCKSQSAVCRVLMRCLLSNKRPEKKRGEIARRVSVAPELMILFVLAAP